MPNSRTIMIFALILTMLGQGSFTLYVPSLPALAHDLHSSATQIKFTLTIFLLSYGISQIFYGPISDIYGRKKPLVFGIILIIIGSIWTIVVKDLWTFNLSRVIQGIGAGATMVLIRAALRDSLSGADLAKGMAFLSIGFAMGLGIFPVVGGVLTHWFNWQADFIFLSIISVIILIIILIYFPETLNKDKEKLSISKYSTQVLKQYWQVIIDKIFWLFLLGGMSAYAVVVAYNVMTPFLFQNVIGLSAQEYGLISIVIGFPYWLGAFLNAKFVKKIGAKFFMLVGAAIIIIAGIFLLIFKFSGMHINIYIVLIPLCFAVFGQALVWSNAMAKSLQSFPEFAGVASAFFSSVQLAISALIAAILALITEVNQLPLSVTILIVGILSALIILCSFWVSKVKDRLVS
jgi:MFS transporter, DHA1 family, 2-module integral membrane pump EmrD